MAHFALFAKRVPPTVASLHRHGLHVTLIQNRPLIRPLPPIHPPHYYSHATSHFHTRCSDTDLPTPTLPAVAVAVRQQCYHDQIDQSLKKLKLKDLASLALATGQPLTGTKTVLVKRISACLAAFMVDIDRFRDQYPHLATSFDLDSIGLLSSDTVAQLKHSILPRSIVSIDVGIRNLAWVELSSRGEILRWSVDDLLGVDGTPEVDGSADPGQAQDLREGAPSQTTHTCTHETTNTKKKVKQSKKAPPPLYDPRSVALRLDQIMQTIVDSDRIEGVIVERQRFRTAGMHSVLDATFKCGVVEGMIHTWLALWEKGSALGSQDKKHKNVVVESISPRAVGTWWSIGSVSRSDNDSSSDESKDSDSEVEASDVDGMSKKSKKTPKYATKKKQSRLIVDGWVQKLGDKENKAGTSDKNHPLRVSCSPTIREWYRLEKKRDDLSDCLLQAVAWYEWREHAMNEALYRYSKHQRPSAIDESVTSS